MLKEEARIFLNNDNDESREVVDFCIKQRKTVVNPIIDWTDEDIWEFIEEYKVRYCSLYDEGFKRLGCIGCPLAGGKHQKREFERWPQYKKLYLMAFEKMIKEHPATEWSKWTNAEECFVWWTGDATKTTE